MNNTSKNNTIKVYCIDHNRKLQVLNCVNSMKRTDIKSYKVGRLDLQTYDIKLS